MNNKDTKRILGWLLAAVVIIGSFLAIIFAGGGGGGGEKGAANITVGNADSEWIKGNPDSTVELVEYSDLQCPACKVREPLIKEILAEFGGHIKFVYRHFPLRGLHKNSDISAQAAEAAGIQGKFWEMHDKLFETQEQWSPLAGPEAENFFVNLAKEMGLNVEQFASDINSATVKSLVNEDLESGQDAGVNSTPTFFLNGKRIQPSSVDQFRSLIRQEIEKTTA